MSSVYSLLQKIRERPGLFLGTKSLTFLRQFLAGYEFEKRIKSWEELTNLDFFEHYSEAKRAIIPKTDEFDWLNFNSYVHSYYGISLTTRNVTSVILEDSASEEEAFDKFFDLLDGFLKQCEK